MSEPVTAVQIPAIGTYTIEPTESSIAFMTKHMFGLGTVKGTFALASGVITVTDPLSNSTAQATVLTASFDSGNPKRDVHVTGADFLDAAAFPVFEFVSAALTQVKGGWVLSGSLTAKGVAAPVEFTVLAAVVEPGGLRIRATGRIDRYAHGIVKSKGMAARYIDLEISLLAVPTSPAPTALTSGEEQAMSVPAQVAVVYYSSTGTTYELAKLIAAGAEGAGATVRVLKVAELAPDEAIASNAGWASHIAETQDVPVATAEDILWADAVVFGTPTRFGNVSSQLKQFIDSLGGQWAQGLLANKVYSGFVSSSTAHGGQESTLLALYNTVHHFGGIVVAPGYTDPVKFGDGNPYGTGHVAGQGDQPISDITKAAAAYQGVRVAKIAAALKAGLAE